MKYTDAIRLGATLAPQAFGMSYDDGAICANAGAFVAAGGSAIDQMPDDYHSAVFLHGCWPGLRQRVHCPVECGIESSVCGIAAHLNDAHRWTRNQISDYLDTVITEPSDYQPVTVTIPQEATCSK
jgi:hypothetical protein